MAKSDFKPAVHGWLILDKPLGLTSTQAIGRCRRLLGGKKVGHGGTLDPLATGVLPLAFGEATKLIPYVMDGDKEYEFTLRWGERRSTDDAEGNVLEQSPIRPAETQVLEALPKFTGVILQKPPAFSAIKVQGERAYDLARSGEQVDLAPREVQIKKIDLIQTVDADHTCFRVSCGKGVYIRSLARDLAAHLGTCGYVSGLKRTKVGAFKLKNACSMPDLERSHDQNAALDHLLPLKAAFLDVPTLILGPSEVHLLQNGQPILIRPQHGNLFEAPLIFAEHNQVPVALVEPIEGEFRVLRGFHF
ncbi:MAG: tRNA pseudouridine(55) synthase TruB [Alphaproteobacteria bacterium]|nr:tRNA pseudouridine(55) synthase TruB [Alphaproteobacteria bacterium]